VKPSLSDREFAHARRRTLLDWRRLPEAPDPARHQSPISALVPKVFEKLGLAQRFRETEIAAAWPEFAGEFAARFSHPLKLKHRVLTVAVSQPAVLWTLDRSRATLLDRLQKKFGSDTIRDIRFQAG
jgi:predicted nucleic acid-binding Zn ribbon protein